MRSQSKTQEAALQHANAIDYDVFNTPRGMGIQIAATSFEDGVNYADEHPITPWVKTSERQPEDKEPVIFFYIGNGKMYGGRYNKEQSAFEVKDIDGREWTVSEHTVSHWYHQQLPDDLC